jgi:hypothetical protein
MAGKTNKTRVTLPGSLADLVRDLQDGGNANAKTAEEQSTTKNAEEKESVEAVKEEAPAAQNVSHSTENASETNALESSHGDRAQEESIVERSNRPIGSEHQREGSDERQQRGRPLKENTMKEYHVQKDDSADSWDLFLDLAKQYKTGGGRPATIYIDPALKSILDRLKYPLSLTTSAILSSIVARFIYDHEDDVRKAIFSQNIF